MRRSQCLSAHLETFVSIFNPICVPRNFKLPLVNTSMVSAWTWTCYIFIIIHYFHLYLFSFWNYYFIPSYSPCLFFFLPLCYSLCCWPSFHTGIIKVSSHLSLGKHWTVAAKIHQAAKPSFTGLTKSCLGRLGKRGENSKVTGVSQT